MKGQATLIRDRSSLQTDFNGTQTSQPNFKGVRTCIHDVSVCFWIGRAGTQLYPSPLIHGEYNILRLQDVFWGIIHLPPLECIRSSSLTKIHACTWWTDLSLQNLPTMLPAEDVHPLDMTDKHQQRIKQYKKASWNAWWPLCLIQYPLVYVHLDFMSKSHGRTYLSVQTASKELSCI